MERVRVLGVERAERHYSVGPVPWGAQGGTALFEFENETGIALAILPGYVGTVLVKDGQVRSVSYVPAKHTPAFAEYRKHRRAMDERRAIATAAAAFGKLENLARRAGPTLSDFMQRRGCGGPGVGHVRGLRPAPHRWPPAGA